MTEKTADEYVQSRFALLFYLGEFGCPSQGGWTFDSSQSSCTRVITELQVPSICDQAHQQINFECFSDVYTPVIADCDSPLTLDSTQTFCEGTETITEPAKPVCADGWTRIDLLCYQTDYQFIQKLCDVDANGNAVTGYTLIDNYCYQETEVSGSVSEGCDEGYTDTGSDCSITLTTTHTHSCESRDWLLDSDNGTCSDQRNYNRQQQFTCPTTHPENADGICETITDTQTLTFTCFQGTLKN